MPWLSLESLHSVIDGGRFRDLGLNIGMILGSPAEGEGGGIVGARGWSKTSKENKQKELAWLMVTHRV